MTGEEDQRPATGHRSIDMLHPDHLDTGARREASQPRQMRILGGDAAEIVPHLPDDAPALRVGEVRQGEIEIAQRPARHREARPNEAGRWRRPRPEAMSNGKTPMAAKNAATLRASSRPSAWRNAASNALSPRPRLLPADVESARMSRRFAASVLDRT
jgi:hypothetical protein